MIAKLIELSLRHASLVIIISVIALILTVVQLPRMPVDVFPELNAPTVVIVSEAGGLAADEVEQYVTFPIETSVNGLAGVRRVRSGSAISLSIVYVEFDWGTDIYRARQSVSERLSGISERLPKGTHSEIAPITGITGEIMLLSLSSPDGSVSDLELRSYAEFELTNTLLAVSGVAQVIAIGGELPEYQVNFNQEKLLLNHVSIDDLVTAAGSAHSTASAGYLSNTGGIELPIRQRASVRSTADIKDTVVAYRDGVALTIGDVAEVTMGGAPKRGTGGENGVPAVILSVQKAPATNTLQLTEAIDKALDQVEASLPKGMKLNRFVMRQADFIKISLENLYHALRDAALFVTIVLILFLLNWRTTVITLAALPLSLAISVAIMRCMGLSLNVMTLGGLAVAIGELVDDAIIDVENVFRRLKENAALPEDKRCPHVSVILSASNEIRSAVVFATLIIVIVFVPLLFLEGIEGRFFQPLGIAYITSILGSLLVALTVTPALCRFLLQKVGVEAGESRFTVALKEAYMRALLIALGRRRSVLAGAVAVTLASLLLASTFGAEFLPRFNEGTITVFLNAPPGTSLQESDRLARSVDKQLAAIHGVHAVVRRTGRAERDAHAEPTNRSEIEVRLERSADREAVLKQLDAILHEIPGISAETGQPLEHRLSHILSGTPAAIAINVYGDDLMMLRQVAKEIEAKLKQIPGTRDVAGNREASVVSLPINYRSHDLRRYGLTPAAAAEQVARAFRGETVSQVNDGVRRYDVVVRISEESRRGVDDVKNFILEGSGGAFVRLSEVADIGREMGSMAIQRENARRKAVISTNVAEGYNLGHLVQEIKEQVDPIVHDHGFSVHYGGQFEAQQSASRTLYLIGGGVSVVVLILLHSAFGSIKAALLVMINLPLALVGGVLAVYLTESKSIIWNTVALTGLYGSYRAPVLSVATLVGFVTLFGIAVRNGILLVDHYLTLEREGVGVEESITRGSVERLVPILMTALSAVLGLVPLALSGGEPGSEILAPLAVVVLGGLVTSTLLNLFVVPAGYALIFLSKDRNV